MGVKEYVRYMCRDGTITGPLECVRNPNNGYIFRNPFIKDPWHGFYQENGTYLLDKKSPSDIIGIAPEEYENNKIEDWM